MRVVEVKLGRVLDDADTLGRIEVVGQRAQERRLAGAGLARDQEVRSGTDELCQQLRHLDRKAAFGDPVPSVPSAREQVEPEPVELADRRDTVRRPEG